MIRIFSRARFSGWGRDARAVIRFRILVAILLCSSNLLLRAQAPEAWVYIDSILVEGNIKTKERLILRELQFKTGDSLPMGRLSDILEFNRLRVMNLGIFTHSKFNVREWKPGNHLVLHLKLTETWFIYPAPLFELADRNFNVWWNEFNRSLKRVNYGLDLNHVNLTGNADQLKLKLQFGYTNKYEVSYRRANINRKQTLGISGNIAYNRAREVSYRTAENKLLFYRNPDAWQITRFTAGLSMQYRPKLFASQTFTLEFYDNRISDSVLVRNTDFFLNNSLRQRHLSFIYNWIVDRRDIRPYPIKGWLSTVEARFNGLLPGDNLRIVRLFGTYEYYHPVFTKNLSIEVRLSGRTSLPRRRPPYYNNQGLGYGGSFVRGYEYYVLDGLDYGLLRTAFHYKAFDFSINFGKFMPLKAFKVLPVKLYLSANNDTGYANDPHYGANNPLTNRLIYGYGLGLDAILYYDKSIRMEWSRNDLGESGFFLRIDAGF